MATNETEKMVSFVRLELYNRALPCGSKAIRGRLDQFYQFCPLPSIRTISRILAKQGLTHRRTGWYEGDQPIMAQVKTTIQ